MNLSQLLDCEELTQVIGNQLFYLHDQLHSKAY